MEGKAELVSTLSELHVFPCFWAQEFQEIKSWATATWQVLQWLLTQPALAEAAAAQNRKGIPLSQIYFSYLYI